MTTPDDKAANDAPGSVVDQEEAERKARRARRRAKRLLNEAETWEEHSATDGRVPPPDGLRPKQRKDVMAVVNQQVRQEARQGAAEAKDTTNLPAEREQQGVARVEPGGRTGGRGGGGRGGDDDGGKTLDPRDAEIEAIQRELVQRRRRRFVLLWLRLAFFVVLPTFLVGNYYYNHATPFYSSEAVFQIKPANASMMEASGGGLLSSSPLGLISDSIAVQDFLTSREAMRVLDAELDLLAHYSDPDIDPIQRLPADASENDAFALYKDRVLVGFDTTEGVMRMEVITADPAMSASVARRLIELAEERVDEMSDRNEGDAVDSAQEVLTDAEAQLDEAYDRVLELQERRGIFSADVEVGLVQGQIAALTSALEERRLSLAALLDNARPNQAQVRVLNAEIARLEQAIEEQRALVVNSQPDARSLARISAELERAQQELEIRQVMVTTAVESLEIARRATAQQNAFLERAVNPVQPVVPSYPRAFEYTVLAFVIFFATYMMVSLTISILREQMSYGEGRT
ncbi:capsule biosynthesis protein [Pontivivens ytuae]|uniref:Capsule biosynthesis protein n=1 Tax=Pontivivens ytuae TaxID=2789856 RepID=A0A7S9QBU5_9RHOB|nr:capsule biosynthesis protein [Pontivivens ytuae]QPH52401.1 capsule biosynthesis protein [Pontivivens ytuae]